MFRPILFHPGEKTMSGFQTLMEPASVAVVGATESEGKAGNIVLGNILENGFAGPVYPINPRADRIMGLKAYPDLLGVHGSIGTVFILLPAEHVMEVIRDCARKEVRSVVIVSSGFGEVGGSGVREQKDIEKIMRGAGIRGIGPNTVGFINSYHHLFASFLPVREWQSGPIAIAAQTGNFSGCIADEIMDRETQRLGIGLTLSFGNKIDLDEVDFLEYTWKKREVGVVALHLESLKRPHPFMAMAARVKKDKPVIVLKSGRTAAGARAAASHTGSLAAEDAIVEAAVRQAGIIRAYTVEEFLEYIKVFSYQPLPRGNRVGIATLSGAAAVIACDELHEEGLTLARYREETVNKISGLMPHWQPVNNPADVWMSMYGDVKSSHQRIIGAVLDDPQVDMALFILLPVANIDFDGVRGVFEEAMKSHPEKPIFTVMLGGRVKQKWMRELEGTGVPIFNDTSIAVRCMKAMYQYSINHSRK